MILPESNSKDILNLFKNDWSSVKEVEERIAAQKAKEEAARVERERQAQAKKDADDKKTQAEKDLEAKIKSIEDDAKAKIDEAKGKREEAEQQAKTSSDRLLIVSKDLETWKGIQDTLLKYLHRYEEEYPVKASTFNHKEVWLLSYFDKALALVNDKFTTASHDKGVSSQLVTLDLANDSQPTGPWTIRIHGYYMEMLANEGGDGAPTVHSSYDHGGFCMKVEPTRPTGTRLGGDRGKGQEWFITVYQGHFFANTVLTVVGTIAYGTIGSKNIHCVSMGKILSLST